MIEEWMHENNCEEIVDGWQDEKMIAYHNERIRRLKIELENLK